MAAQLFALFLTTLSKSSQLLNLKGITLPFKPLGTPSGSKPGNKCSFNFFFDDKFADKYQSCQP